MTTLDDDDRTARAVHKRARVEDSRADVRTPPPFTDDDRARRPARETDDVPDVRDDAAGRDDDARAESRAIDRARLEAVPPATLAIERWTRDEATTRRKRHHMDALDARGGFYGVEAEIERAVLGNADVAIEVNAFPYATPRGVTHMTVWSRREMREMEGVEWTSRWLRENAPRVDSWNFDANENTSVDVPHYHVFTHEPVEEVEEEVEGEVEEAVEEEEAARAAKRARRDD